MTVPALVLEALGTLRVDQAGLARRMGVGQSAVSKWISGSSRPDYESCLRLAQITGVPARQVLEMAGHDASLLPIADDEALTPVVRDILVRISRIQAAIDATEGLPEDFVDVYLRKVLDNTEEGITSMIRMVRQLRHEQQRTEVTALDTPEVSDGIITENSDSTGLDDDLTRCQKRLVATLVGAKP